MTSLEAQFQLLLPPGGDPARLSCDPGSGQDPNHLDVDRVPVKLSSHSPRPPPFTRDDSGNLPPDATITLDVEDNSISQGKQFQCAASGPSTLISLERRHGRPEKIKDESERAAGQNAESKSPFGGREDRGPATRSAVHDIRRIRGHTSSELEY
ncbi:hypothetical protein R3P38DRAFT_2787386 [Favolaschia claudopus]|uniref:Uncharacterized protein n=1 Tax=Favolaschia claudopus TaxID=2862362 RepID=A0AAW0AMM2_9AGAR